MKTVLIKVTATIFIFLFSGMFANIYSGEWIDKVVVDKKIDVKSDARLIIDHEYGNVRCRNWDKNEIAVKVTIRVKTKDEEMAAKIIDKVIVDVDGSSSKVKAYCDLNQRLQGNSKIQVSIDFDIYMPSTVFFELDQSFGTSYVESVSGPTSISSDYSSLEIGSLSNAENNIELNFSEANIASIMDGNVEISYSEFNLSNANKVSLETEYSSITIGKASSVTMELEGGSAVIGEVNTLYVEADFSSLEIKKLISTLVAETEYGSLKIGSVDKGFSSIAIENGFGSIAIGLSKDIACRIELEGEFGSFNFPEKLIDISYKKVGHTSTVIKGVIGKGANPSSVITLDYKYGSVDLSVE
ncbi:MAG: hypothetical protein QM503_11400 [Bacteroidota bacterium]